MSPTGPSGAARPAAPRRPSLALLALEGPRAAAELTFFATFRPLLERAPHGDGHPVLVLPGMGGSDRSTVPMRRFLRRLGYDAQGWGLGVNRPTREVQTQLSQRFARFVDEHDGVPVSVVGWSLGGIYARELARTRPASVRQVITLGSPFRNAPGEESHPTAVLNVVAPGRPRRRLEQGPLAVPSTAIFSRTDGIVPWRASRDVAGRRAESIEVISSHCGLGHHPGALWAIADRLAQPSGDWQPFRASLRVAALYPPRRRPSPR